MSAKFDEDVHNSLVAIAFTRIRRDPLTDWRTHGLTEPRQRYYIPSATRCAGIIKMVLTFFNQLDSTSSYRYNGNHYAQFVLCNRRLDSIYSMLQPFSKVLLVCEMISLKKKCLWYTIPQGATKSEKAIFSIKVRDLGVIWKHLLLNCLLFPVCIVNCQ